MRRFFDYLRGRIINEWFMQLFYAPDIVPPRHVLSEDESRHCIRVLRMCAGDRLYLTDGRGNMYTAEIIDPDPARCGVAVVETVSDWGRRDYALTMAVAPTKNMDRYEWFLEKATEIGCDTFIPIECARSERRTIKPERAVRVITGAVKQSLKARHPVLETMVGVKKIIDRPFGGVRLIAHCGDPVNGRRYISQYVNKGDDVLVLIGPEGDFSPEEVAYAVDRGFGEITLGDVRMRTETAALDAVIEVAMVNR